MKVVYCIPGTYNSGGMERVLANKVNWLVNNGYDVSIITTDQRSLFPFFYIDPRVHMYDIGINYELDKNKSFVIKCASFVFKQIKHYKALSALIKELCPDIAISMFCNDAPVLLKIRGGFKKVLEVHFSRFKRLQYGRKGVWALVDKFMNWRDGKIARRFDRFVVLTQEDLRYWGKMTNVLVIPNARTFETEFSSDLRNKVVLAIGRYTYQKGFERLICSWAVCSKKFPDWKLKIIGSGEDEAELLALVQSKGLSKSVFLQRPTNNIIEEYLTSSVVAMTSRYEGLPMVLLEAQAVGLPVVTFDCKCGPKDIITDGVDGYLVPEGDLNMFAEKLSILMKDDNMRLAFGRAAKKASERNSEENVMIQWDKLFQTI